MDKIAPSMGLIYIFKPVFLKNRSLLPDRNYLSTAVMVD